MATFAVSTPASLGLSNRFAALRQSWNDAMARRRRFNQVYSELAQLSDRDLADIGISRLQIVDIAQEAAYGRA